MTRDKRHPHAPATSPFPARPCESYFGGADARAAALARLLTLIPRLMPPSSRPAESGLSQYRPVLDRALFGFSLLGLLVVVHLWIQQARGFDRGCFGFNTAFEKAQQTFDCELVAQSSQGTFLGLSNVVWGFGFYLVVALLCAGVAFLPDRRALFKQLRAAAVGLGFLYALYLVYAQFTQVGALCALCLVSSAITTLLFALVSTDLYRSKTPS